MKTIWGKRLILYHKHMTSFDPQFLERLTFPHRMFGIIRKIGAYQGKQEMYAEKAPEMLANLQMVAIIESVESSNRIENIVVGPKTIAAIVREQQPPAKGNRPQGEVAGYRDVLKQMHERHENIPFTDNLVLQFHRDMMKYTAAGGGVWKNSQNQIAEKFPDGTIKKIRFDPTPPHLTPDAMRQLHTSFNYQLEKGEIDPLLLIPLYVLDFLCIHPFSDGNGRMSRLLTTLLLYHQHYDVCCYISLERLVEQTKDSYYETLYESSQGWHENNHNPLPFVEYLLGVILAAYGELEDRIETVRDIPGVKTQMVHTALKQFKGEFSFGELIEACPFVSKQMVRKVLNDMNEDGKVMHNNKQGRSAKWRVTDNDTNEHE